MERQEKLTPRPVPWGTLFIALLAGLALVSPAAMSWFIYDRVLIFRGEIWRAWSGHMAHFGTSHFIWNLAVFIPAGCWLERSWPALTRWFYVLCPLLISAALLVLDPSLLRYAGLSGLGTGMLVLLAVLQLGRRKVEPAWFWLSVLALVAVKIGIELFTGTPIFVSGFTDVRTVPLAHVFGVVGAVLFWVAARFGKNSPDKLLRRASNKNIATNTD